MTDVCYSSTGFNLTYMVSPSMEVYIIVMYSLSSIGVFIIFCTLYLLITVPTKLNAITRFVIHGHDLSAAAAQLFMTLGTVPCIIFPCASGYPSGLLTYFKLMSTFNQCWSQMALIAISATFSLLLTINRTFSVVLKLQKWKNCVLMFFFAQLFCQVLGIVIVGLNMQDGGEEAKLSCQKLLHGQYPEEMNTHDGINIILSTNIGLKIALLYMTAFTGLYTIVASTCVILLIRSIKNQGKSSQSAQFLSSQRKITVGVITFVMLESVGMGLPIMCLVICACFRSGTPAIAQYSMLSICFYPILEPYCVLMPNAAYRNKIYSIISLALPKSCLANRNRTIVQVVPCRISTL